MQVKDQSPEMKNNIPVIFVPGLFGSMGNEIIPGTGKWSFGIAKLVYDPFIVLLETMGYKLNESLFIAFYDWRKRCSYSAKKYLLKTIKHVRQKTNTEKVNLICHSMGGLVARTYVQSGYYADDVENLIVISTPNAGSAPNYSYWAGGELPGNLKLGLNMVRLYMDEYMLLFKKVYKTNNIEAIHTHFPGLYDIIPSKQYGEYLFYKEKTGMNIFKPYCLMKCKNAFLDELNATMSILEERKIKVTVIAGIGEETINYLHIEPSFSSNIWIDGRVVGFTTSSKGDGNAMLHSVFQLAGDKYVLHASHINILYKCEHILRKVLLAEKEIRRSCQNKQ